MKEGPVLQGGFVHLTAHQWEKTLLPERWPDFSTCVCRQGVKPGVMEGCFGETGSDPVGGGLSISICQRNYNWVVLQIVKLHSVKRSLLSQSWPFKYILGSTTSSASWVMELKIYS